MVCTPGVERREEVVKQSKAKGSKHGNARDDNDRRWRGMKLSATK